MSYPELTHFRLNKLSHTIHWRNPISVLCLFVSVEVLLSSQTIRVILSEVSLPNHTLFLGGLSPLKQLLVHILSPETDNFPS